MTDLTSSLLRGFRRGATAAQRGTGTVRSPAAEPDTLWYKDGVFYEVPVRSFRDADGDGIGDLRGLTEKLDYIAELGVSAVWVLPFYPSPGRDDGYDVSDYRAVNPDYGTLRDFRRFVAEAHRRGLRVVTELVANHTSDEHAWFQRARRARPGSPARQRYVWSNDPNRYADARVIFKDFEKSNWTWDPVAGAYYWHRFYSHQPDLNFESPLVWRDLFSIVDFWLGMGVDGLRLDAVPYLYEREGTNCENLPETHEFLRALRRHVDERFPGRMLIAEANQWPEKAVAYFGSDAGDECHMAFHFPVMPRLYLALRREDRFPIADILRQTPDIPESAQWAFFLRNHDELTLEMVTDEERDYMYRVYAHDPQMRVNLGIRRRLTQLLGNNRRRIELLYGVLFSLPGSPFIYYGDEIGMGDNVYLGDRNGVRTPMQWSADVNAGFSGAPSSDLYLPVITDPDYHYATVNVAHLEQNPQSILSWTRRLIHLRRRHPVFGHGTMKLLDPDNSRILAYLRSGAEEQVLVVANLSRFAQPARLTLPDHASWRVTELFGQTAFPHIGEDGSMTLTLAPHTFLWFALEPPVDPTRLVPEAHREVPDLPELKRWPREEDAALSDALSRALAVYLPTQPWFRGSLRHRAAVEVYDVVPIGNKRQAALVIVRADVIDGDDTLYLVALRIAARDETALLSGGSILARARGGGVLTDAASEPRLGGDLLDALSGRRRLHGWRGEIVADAPAELQKLRSGADRQQESPPPARSRNTTLRAGGALIKLYRRPESGSNVELEVGCALREYPVEGTSAMTVGLNYRRAGAHMIVGGVGPWVSNQGSGWISALDAVSNTIEGATPDMLSADPLGGNEVLGALAGELSERCRAVVGDWTDVARQLGARTAMLHGSLAKIDEPSFAPEPFGEHYQRALYQSIRNRFHEARQAAHSRATKDARRGDDAARLMTLFDPTDRHLRRLLDHPFDCLRIRGHGDLRLEHFLVADGAMIIVDFEGDPTRPMSERRIKRSPYHDVAALAASLAEAAGAGLELARQRSTVWRDDPELESWLVSWVAGASAAMLDGYRARSASWNTALVPRDPDDSAVLLRALLIDALCARIAAPPGEEPARLDLLVPALIALVS